MSNKKEQKVINDVNVNEVPSLDKIKTRMDFSKHDFKELKEVFYSESKLKQACFKTFLITFIICVICTIIVIRIDNVFNNESNGILTKDEIAFIEENNEIFNNDFIYYYNMNENTNINIYIFEAKNATLETKNYYYKIKGIYNNDLKLSVNDKTMIITKDNIFGLLWTSSGNETIRIEIEYDGVKINHSFSK